MPEQRSAFMERLTEREWDLFRERLDRRFDPKVTFPVNRTPLFVPAHIQKACEEAALELSLRVHDEDYLKISDAALHPEITVGGQPDHASFVSVDFALTVGEGGEILPKLIELQGFPSLMGYQLLYAELLQEHFQIDPKLTPINGGISRAEFLNLLRRTIVGDHSVDEVVLMDLDPWEQKTRPDFFAIRELLGISVVDVRDVEKEGRQLYRRDEEGERKEIRRIYNRTIVDEIERREVVMPFNWNDDLDVEWAGHPNWFFRISKFSLPFLDHPLVPPSRFLHKYDEWPADLGQYVLKPLYSFAGTGVIVGPTAEDLDAIPVEERKQYILQEKVPFEGIISTPGGEIRAELRIMMIWPPEDPEPTPVMSLVRTGRGDKMGVDEAGKEVHDGWVGATCAFYET